MNSSTDVIQGPGYIAEKKHNGVDVTFDPGAHLSQDITVFLTFDEFEIIKNDISKFEDIISTAMREQNITIK